jgi:hypothetical protein
MKLYILIFLIICINLFADKFDARLTKNQLRNMYKEELERLILESFVKTFDSIYDKIIECEKLGKMNTISLLCAKSLLVEIVKYRMVTKFDQKNIQIILYP